jgi:hypothetical protein
MTGGADNMYARKQQQQIARKNAPVSTGVRQLLTAVANTTGKHKAPARRGEVALR